ncbi:hypothetical protein BH24BAC1_BH24BAC1_16330 [soil metagenome]
MKKDPEGPPFFNSWKSMYWLVLGNLALMVLVFYLITRYYA